MGSLGRRNSWHLMRGGDARIRKEDNTSLHAPSNGVCIRCHDDELAAARCTLAREGKPNEHNRIVC